MYRLSFDGQVNAALNSRFPQLIFEFTESIDANKLQKATEKALEYHPAFKTKLVKKHHKYYLDNNPKQPIVISCPWDQPLIYGDDSSNNYSWIITCWENKVLFTCAHFVCDGMGALNLLNDIFNLYFGYDVKRIENISKAYEDSYNTHLNKKAKEPFKRKKVGEPEKIPLSFFETRDKKCDLYRIIIPNSIIKNIDHKNETSTAPVISGLLCKSLANALNLDDGIIKIMMSVNLRPFYNSITDTGFVLVPNLEYNIQKLKNRDMFYTDTAIRGQLDLFIDKDNLDYQIKQECMKNKLLNIFPGILSLARKEYDKMLYAPSMNFVYTQLGEAKFKTEIKEKIKAYYIAGSDTATPLIVFMESMINDEISLTIGEFSKNHAILQELEKVMTQEGIDYKKELIHTHGHIMHIHID